MSCFSCMTARTILDDDDDIFEIRSTTSSDSSSGHGRKKALFNSKSDLGTQSNTNYNVAHSFKFHQLASATNNFKIANMIGQGGFGKVYKGRLLQTDQLVAVKRLDNNSLQGNQEFIVEVLMLSLLHHINLVTLIGYCTDGDHRLLVYEYMPMGSVEDHLFDLKADKKPLDWNTRVKIALGAARGLEFLHTKANPPVIYRDLKSANILLDEDFNPKLSDFGLAKLGPVGDNTHVSTRVMGTYGYCAPEYAMSGKLTLKSDIYSFGVVLLELISGRKAIDPTRKYGEQSIIAWSHPFLRDRKKFIQLVDPHLEGCYPVRCLHHAVAITAMCLQEQPNFRPLVSDIVLALEYLASHPYRPSTHSDKCSPPHTSPTLRDGGASAHESVSIKSSASI